MKNKLEIRFKELSELLQDQMSEEGFWKGELSSSALAVAVAINALHFHNAKNNLKAITKGLNWLQNNINSSGSYGDTNKSPGNVSTSLLVYAALNLYADTNDELKTLQNRVRAYLIKNSIDPGTDSVSEAILKHYKKDYTFSVPILTMCALCGIPGNYGFAKIPQLPFELALMPRKFYKLLNLSVVSYAIPALIAVGIVIFKNKKSGKLQARIRGKAIKRCLEILHQSMPESGGFLEAVPLTAFVSLSLLNAGYRNTDVVEKGIAFLERTQRNDGGWPIDVDLSTWVTTLSIKALGKRKDQILAVNKQTKLVEHLKAVQNKSIHPFNGTEPGGWGWTNYSGSVPDCDDTPGAILALLQFSLQHEVEQEVIAGGKWLLKLQNKDGGFPTFSKGWGKLPFDQSCADLSGHAFLAIAMLLHKSDVKMPPSLQNRLIRSLHKSVKYLKKNQRENGSWIPLWFGNQHTPNHENPVYGTARVLCYLKDALAYLENFENLSSNVSAMISHGEQFLLHTQNKDGSWGGDKNCKGSMEETALAVSALSSGGHSEILQNGLNWLDAFFLRNGVQASPIGLYFASLWYDEKMYPLTAYLEAVNRCLEA